MKKKMKLKMKRKWKKKKRLKKKRPRADYTPAPSAEVKNEWMFNTIVPYAFKACIWIPLALNVTTFYGLVCSAVNVLSTKCIK